MGWFKPKKPSHATVPLRGAELSKSSVAFTIKLVISMGFVVANG